MSKAAPKRLFPTKQNLLEGEQHTHTNVILTTVQVQQPTSVVCGPLHFHTEPKVRKYSNPMQ